MNRLLLALTPLIFCTSCAIDSNSKREEKRELAARQSVEIGGFRDSRGLPNNYLGSIRGTGGAPNQKVETDVVVSDIVAKTFGHGLHSRDLVPQSGHAAWTLTGEVKEFACDQVELAGCSVDLVVKLTKAGSSHPAFNKSFTAEKTERPSSGNAARGLQRLAAETLQQAVDKALDDPEFRQVISGVYAEAPVPPLPN